MKNILTFDIEDWYHANYDGNSLIVNGSSSNFRRNMDRLLCLCSENNCKATFFVLGCIGEQYGDVIRRISDEGHEVASHGYSHELAYKQTRQEFTDDVGRSIGILEDITGKKVLGYRAPSWSIVEKNMDYLEALEELGLKFDASIFPVRTFLYGIPDAKREIHKPVINGRMLNLYEVPTSVFSFAGKTAGYSGGFYFRVFPYLMIKKLIRSANKTGMPSIVYLHPREIDENENRLNLPPMERFIHYTNIRGAYGKLEKVVKCFEFTSINLFLEDRFGFSISDGIK